MAGQVTGNLGNENITLRNIATEDTMQEILEVLGTKTISDNGGGKLRTQAEGAAAKIKDLGKVATSITGLFSSIGTGTIKIVRNLDQNIDNVSYSFSTMATSLNRTNPALAKLFSFAGESAAQMQEQYNAYSKMIAVGGTTADGFKTLREDAAGLGTDLRGLAALTEQYSTSLKIGSSTTAGGLKKLKDTFSIINDDTQMLSEFGRIGVLPEKISEQLLLAAEAQGGFGNVMKKYGNDAGAFGKGMLKSSQELNVFATAIGANSQLMQQEAAKATKRASDQIFVNSLKGGEKMTYQYLHALTGNAEKSLEIMRSVKSGITSQDAGLFLATKNITGMGNEIESFMDMVSKGSEPLEALTKSGLMDFSKNMSDEKLRALSDEEYAQRVRGNTQLADIMNFQLGMVQTLRSTDPSKIGEHMKELTEKLDPSKAKTIDSFTALHSNQVKLAQSTASVNTQINRLGLALASGMMKSTTLGIGAMGKGVDGAKAYVNAMLASYGITETLPDKLFDGPIEKIEEAMQMLINTHLSKSPTVQNQATMGSVPESSDKIKVKLLNGKDATLSVSELINEQQKRAATEAFKGANNQAGTIVLGGLLQQKIKSLGTVTAGDDNDPIHNKNGAHPKGRALDFRVNNDPNKTAEQNYKDTEAQIQQVLESMGLKKEDFKIISELNAKGGAHMHVEITNQAAVDKIRDEYVKKLTPNQDTNNQDNKPKASSQEQPANDGSVKNSQAPQGTVNTIPVVSIAKPDWFDAAMAEGKKETASALRDLKQEFSTLATALKRKL